MSVAGFDLSTERGRRLLANYRESARYVIDHNDGFYKRGEVRNARDFLLQTEGLLDAPPPPDESESWFESTHERPRYL